jgi:hypothetical protein
VTKAIIIAIILGLMGLSSWWMTRRARLILGRSLGRKLKTGEETSLKAWMSVPDAALAAAPEQMGGNPAERVLGVIDSLGRHRSAVDPLGRHDDPWTDPNSIR